MEKELGKIDTCKRKAGVKVVDKKESDDVWIPKEFTIKCASCGKTFTITPDDARAKIKWWGEGEDKSGSLILPKYCSTKCEVADKL